MGKFFEKWLIEIPQSLNFEAEQVLLPLKILMMYFLYLFVRNAKMDSTLADPYCKKPTGLCDLI